VNRCVPNTMMAQRQPLFEKRSTYFTYGWLGQFILLAPGIDENPGQIDSFGAPSKRAISSSWCGSDRPGSKVLWRQSSPSIHPTPLQQRPGEAATSAAHAYALLRQTSRQVWCSKKSRKRPTRPAVHAPQLQMTSRLEPAVPGRRTPLARSGGCG
jgi:hypothetical protein